MSKQHHYQIYLNWTGNKGEGTSSYKSYDRAHKIMIAGKPEILASSDPAFRGDPARHNPEELFLASVSSCHMLWYLHLCSEQGIVVTAYTDNAEGLMEENADGSGRFISIILRPVITIRSNDHLILANELHQAANKKCFIANSLNFKVGHQPEILVG